MWLLHVQKASCILCNKMTFGSLFAGVGGFDLGLERAGMVCKWQVEIDGFCQKVLAKHWPDVPRFVDVRDCGMHNLEPVNLIAGGFPCQDVSIAGKRKGLQGEQSGLWAEFARIVCEVKPRWVLVENVPGLLSSNAGRDFGTILRDLAACGYDAEWDCIPAAAFGAPHLRYRVFIVAYSKSCGIGGQGEGDENSRVGFASSGQGFLGASPISAMAHSQSERALSVQQQGQLCGIKSGSKDVAHAACFNDAWAISEGNHGRKSEGTARNGSCVERSNWWAIEPDMGRVVARFSPELDGGLNAHEECLQEARRKGIPQTERLRELWQYQKSTKASSESPRCSFCGHPLSALPCEGACRPWYLGQRVEEVEDMRCMREGILYLLSQSRQDLLKRVPINLGQEECSEEMASRVDRLRALGNAVVPQVAEWLGRQIIKANQECGSYES